MPAQNLASPAINNVRHYIHPDLIGLTGSTSFIFFYFFSSFFCRDWRDVIRGIKGIGTGDE
jgi:predicted PurR-regulated permease PerM